MNEMILPVTQDPWRAIARYLAVNAFPLDLPYPVKFERRCAAILQDWPRTFAQCWPDRAATMPIKPDVMSDKELEQLMRNLSDGLRQAGLAGKMVFASLKQAVGEIVNLPGDGRFSVNRICNSVVDESNFADPHDLEHAIWRPRRPVFHIVAATAGLAYRLTTQPPLPQEDNTGPDPARSLDAYLFCNPHELLELVAYSEFYADLMTKSPVLGRYYHDRMVLRVI